MLRPFCQHVNNKRMLHYVTACLRRDVTSCPLSGQYRGADKSSARPGRKQATATGDFDFHISYL
jgi:hypothetical protein